MSQNSYEAARVTLRKSDREAAWGLAEQLGGRDLSVWRLEAFKSALDEAERRPGFLHEAVHSRNPTGVAHFLGRLRFTIAAGVAAFLFAFWLMRFGMGRNGNVKITNAARVAAIHGEVTSRTRHLLTAMKIAKPPLDAVVLLGRIREPRQAIVAMLQSYLGPTQLPPVVIPSSLRAYIASIADWPGLFSQGLQQRGRIWVTRSFSDLIRIAFRVRLGLVQARWWQQNGPSGSEVLFGITGTADTTLLERAIQHTGGKSAHLVHGQTTGPNLLGISDMALFRCGLDAATYRKLGLYGECDVQRDAMALPSPRADTGVLLLTNLAHPMNGDYRRLGASDEIGVIRAVAQAARELRNRGQPLLWKPHPISAQLPEAQSIREIARSEGFIELQGDSSPVENAAKSRWIFSTPSTVALDLLQAGWLSIILDPQGSVRDDAISRLPICSIQVPDLASAICRFDNDATYIETFHEAFRHIMPAGRLSVSWAQN